MAQGRAVAIVLEAAEKNELTALTRKHGAPRHWRNGRALSWLRPTASTTEIAAKVGICAATAGRWRNRFAKHRIDGLYTLEEIATDVFRVHVIGGDSKDDRRNRTGIQWQGHHRRGTRQSASGSCGYQRTGGTKPR